MAPLITEKSGYPVLSEQARRLAPTSHLFERKSVYKTPKSDSISPNPEPEKKHHDDRRDRNKHKRINYILPQYLLENRFAIRTEYGLFGEFLSALRAYKWLYIFIHLSVV